MNIRSLQTQLTGIAFMVCATISCNTTTQNVRCEPAKIGVLVIDNQADTAFIVKRYIADGTFTQLIDSSIVAPFFLRSDANGTEIPTDTVFVSNVLHGYDYSITIPSTGMMHKIVALTDDGHETMQVKCKDGNCPTCAAQLVSYTLDGQVTQVSSIQSLGILMKR